MQGRGEGGCNHCVKSKKTKKKQMASDSQRSACFNLGQAHICRAHVPVGRACVCTSHRTDCSAAAAAAITGSLPGPELQTLSASSCGLQSVTLLPSLSINNITERLAERRAAAETLCDCAAAELCVTEHLV